MSVKGQVFIGQEGDKMEQNFVLIDPKICTLFFFFFEDILQYIFIMLPDFLHVREDGQTLQYSCKLYSSAI